MAQKSNITLGILLVFDAGWIGGNNYVVSLVNSFAYLPPSEQPNLIIYYSKANTGYLKQVTYYHVLEAIETAFYDGKGKSYLRSLLTGKNQFLKKLPGIEKTVAVFPLMDMPGNKGSYTGKLIGWLPDFRHKEKPGDFTRIGRILREFKFRMVLKNCDLLVLSSNHAKKHFIKFYPSFVKNTAVQVLQFVSLAPQPTTEQIETTRSRYEKETPFFLLSNQFYVHKNHQVVFEAVALLKKKGLNIMVICTGKTDDQWNPGFFQSQLDLMSNLGVEGNIRIMGMIDRTEQLSLMKMALAIIQPSKYEGWNTSVEDGKKLGVQVIASAIDVHLEQLPGSPHLFNPADAQSLAAIMEAFMTGKVSGLIKVDYDQEIRNFAQKFMQVVSSAQSFW